MVAGLLYSKANTITAPIIISEILTVRTILVCRHSLLKKAVCGISLFLMARIFFKMSNHTIKPSPPIVIRNIVVRFTLTFVAYPARLDGPIKSIPALQNAEIEVNTDIHMPLASPKSGINVNE